MSPDQQTVEPWLREILRCPRCKGELTDVTDADGALSELVCATDALAYPVEDGVPVLLVDLARSTRA